MSFVTIDGDDIGRRLAACYLSNDIKALEATRELVDLKTHQISNLLTDLGYRVLFCAADGVTAHSNDNIVDDMRLYQSIENIAGLELAFSVGVGETLREAYVALLFAKSTGKARLCNFSSMETECLE
ncbi:MULTISPECIES: mCpol domain-containing protein [unclassified Sulfitobacter]|jgi:hypothetical protein|uniref:mCpol domain-containing protein n=1 Tax=unclassified Sulfitobacter TaxID=196795 RepID=UPI0004E2A494|nr:MULTISPECIES: mCpol domain-containing protein [unclassified Sulfitobacter]PTA97685.1 mCpol domain-containing protein [Sulfitobacter sp. CB-A]ULO22123.1 mCpol domain-containing protein [Sulfitobacter sp. CB2047]